MRKPQTPSLVSNSSKKKNKKPQTTTTKQKQNNNTTKKNQPNWNQILNPHDFKKIYDYILTLYIIYYICMLITYVNDEALFDPDMLLIL